MNIWTEHRNPEGRTYWFNTGTKESVWEKPYELKTPFERALSKTKWKEYFTNGRKYYYNTETKESSWVMPEDVLQFLEESQVDANNAPPGSASAKLLEDQKPKPSGEATQGAPVPMGGANTSLSTSSQPQQQNGVSTSGTSTPSLAVGAHTGGLPLSANSVLPARPHLPDDPVIPHNGFATVEEGEKAFIHLLKKAGVDANWTWDQTMRAIITDPLYKALNTLAEKKACWEKYTNGLRAKEQEEKEARLAKLRPAVRNMLKGNPNVFHYTTFRTADKLFAQHPIWQQARIESERRLIFEEYVTELKQREVQESRAARARSVSKVVALFKQLGVDVVTRWRTAHNLLLESEEWKGDAELQKLPTLDMLLAFEDYSRVREREYEEQTRRAQVEKTRKERKAREAFKSLLQELVDQGRIKARSKWKEVYPLFKGDERYLNMLGNPGSNPLELFWDAVDALDQKLDAKIAIVEEVLRHHTTAQGGEVEKANIEKDGDVKMGEPDNGFVIQPETKEEDYMSVVKSGASEAVKELSQDDLHEVFSAFKDQALKKQAEERRRAERRQRHLQDDLRYAMKKLPAPLDISLPYEEVVPLIEHLPEYKAIEDEEGRRAAFAKYVKRQKERLREVASEDGGSTTSRKRKEPTRDYREDRDREKEKEREREREKEREREREREKEKDREYREREKEKERGKDYDRGSRGSKHHHRYDDYDDRRSRDYGRDRERDRDDRDRDGYRSSRRREDDRRRDKDRRGSRTEYYGREWDDTPKRDRERSTSVYQDESRDKRDWEGGSHDGRAEKRLRYDRDEAPSEPMEVDKRAPSAREETPEEGEI